jgi:Ca2+-binding RTX toxin-like protein
VFVRIGVLAGVVLAQALAPAATALAATVSVQVAGGQLVVQAGAAQANRVVVAHADGLLSVTDAVPVVPGAGCRAVTRNEVVCAPDRVTSIDVELGDLADSFSYKGKLAVKASGGAGDDRLYGGTGTDVMTGDSGDDLLSGGLGDDALTGDLGADDLFGGGGDDVVYGDRAYATSACLSLPQPGCADELHGDDGADQLRGGEWADLYRGGPGNDLLDDPSGGGGNILDGGTGDDVIDGSSEVMRDVLDYSARGVGVEVDLAAGTGGEPGELDLIANVQDIQGSAGNDKLAGNVRNNRIYGNGGFDTITGGGGTDLCVGELLTGC